jgi:hypothetical protein
MMRDITPWGVVAAVAAALAVGARPFLTKVIAGHGWSHYDHKLEVAARRRDPAHAIDLLDAYRGMLEDIRVRLGDEHAIRYVLDMTRDARSAARMRTGKHLAGALLSTVRHDPTGMHPSPLDYVILNLQLVLLFPIPMVLGFSSALVARLLGLNAWASVPLAIALFAVIGFLECCVLFVRGRPRRLTIYLGLEWEPEELVPRRIDCQP